VPIVVPPLNFKIRFQKQIGLSIKDGSDLLEDRSGCVTSVFNTEVTEDRKDQGPNWMCRSVLGPMWPGTEV